MKSTFLKFGSNGLLVGFIIFFLHLFFGVDNLSSATNEIIGYVSIFISLSFIFFGIKHYRDHINNGIISVGKAIQIGIIIAFLVGLDIAMADFIYTKFIDPSFFTNYEQKLIAQGKEDEIVKLTSTTAALFMLVLVTILGFIISLISGIILQRKK